MMASPVMGADPDYLGWAGSTAVSQCGRRVLEAAASILIDGALRPYQNGVCVVTGAVRERTWICGDGPALVILARLANYAAVRGMPECMT